MLEEIYEKLKNLPDKVLFEILKKKLEIFLDYFKYQNLIEDILIINPEILSYPTIWENDPLYERFPKKNFIAIRGELIIDLNHESKININNFNLN
jgi:hypothetical protein